MKAQELRDKIAAVRNFNVLVDGKEVGSVLIDIEHNLVCIKTVEKKEEVKKEPMMEVKKEEVKVTTNYTNQSAAADVIKQEMDAAVQNKFPDAKRIQDSVTIEVPTKEVKK